MGNTIPKLVHALCGDRWVLMGEFPDMASANQFAESIRMIGYSATVSSA